MHEPLIIIYLANIGSIFLLYLGVWAQDRRPYILYFLLGWLCYFLSYAGYFPFLWFLDGPDSSAYRVYSQGTYYASSVLLYFGVLRLLKRRIELPALLTAGACIVLAIVGSLVEPRTELPTVAPAAVLNTAMFWHAAVLLLGEKERQRLILALAAIGLIGWGASLAAYPFVYRSETAMTMVYVSGGGFAVLLMLDLVVLHYSVIHAELTAHTNRIAFLTYHEVMTGLFNRNYLNLRLLHGADDALGLPVSLIMFDIDGLKQVNDGLGHKAGDELVIQFARLLKSTLRDHDLALRIGGDEFLLLLPRTTVDGAAAILNRIRAQAETGLIRPISFSAGIAIKERAEENLEELLQHADADMYAQKQRRKDQAESLIAQYIDSSFGDLSD